MHSPHRRIGVRNRSAHKCIQVLWRSHLHSISCAEAQTPTGNPQASRVQLQSISGAWGGLLYNILGDSLTNNAILYLQVMRNDEWDKTGGVGCGMSGNNC
jgi:hypothetical protein